MFKDSSFRFTLSPDRRNASGRMSRDRFRVRGRQFVNGKDRLLPSRHRFGSHSTKYRQDQFRREGRIIRSDQRNGPSNLQRSSPFRSLSIHRSRKIDHFPLTSQSKRSYTASKFNQVNATIRHRDRSNDHPHVRNSIRLQRARRSSRRLSRGQYTTRCPGMRPDRPFRRPTFQGPRSYNRSHRCGKRDGKGRHRKSNSNGPYFRG